MINIGLSWQNLSVGIVLLLLGLGQSFLSQICLLHPLLLPLGKSMRERSFSGHLFLGGVTDLPSAVISDFSPDSFFRVTLPKVIQSVVVGQMVA